MFLRTGVFAGLAVAWFLGSEGCCADRSGRFHLTSLRLPLALLAASIVVIVAVWQWLSVPVSLARAPISADRKLECVSYAPFRGAQTPFDPSFRLSAEQISEDLAQLARITDCVRTYSVDNGLDQVPALAQKAGLKVLQGIWLGSDRFKNRLQVDSVVALAKEYPGVITSVIVGNEVLLRGEMTPGDLAATIRLVKSQVTGIPVTYADVWEFWLRHREVYDAVDFVTIHILPYWEDIPVRAKYAAAHVDSIRKRMAIAFPNKEILIGETGWPSAGRMREGALPSRVNQARVVSEVLELARREKFRVNLIEAYDQPWKRQLEGTVGGYWGLFAADPRELKYPVGQPINNFPRWRLDTGLGIAFSAAVFLAAMVAVRRRPWPPRWPVWIAVGASATTGGILLGVAIDKMLVEGFGAQGVVRSVALVAAGVLTPIFGASALATGKSLPAFTEVVGPRHLRTGSFVRIGLGLCLALTALLALESALGFVFDPRYRDFPFAALTMATVPLLLVMLFNRPAEGVRPMAEAVFAGALVLSAGYILINEGRANWQSIWTCILYIALGLTMWRARAVQIRE